MNTRNFYILVAAVCIGITAFWLSAYNIVKMDIDIINYIEKNVNAINQEETNEEEEIILKIIGNVKKEVELTLSDIKSDYNQIEDKNFEYKNTYEGPDDEDTVYSISGPTLWSILVEEDVLEDDVSTFVFIGVDGYQSSPLDISLAEDNEDKVVIAHEIDGEPLIYDYEHGPLRAVVHRDLVPEGENSPYWVYKLKYIKIE